jgi:hypothetical protein
MSVRMRWLALVGLLLLGVAGAHAQSVESNDASTAQPTAPKYDVDVGSLPSTGRAVPKLKSEPIKPDDSILSGLDLGGSKLQFEGDRKPPENRVGAETFAPGTLVQSQKSRQIGPTFFGLSIKKSLQ